MNSLRSIIISVLLPVAACGSDSANIAYSWGMATNGLRVGLRAPWPERPAVAEVVVGAASGIDTNFASAFYAERQLPYLAKLHDRFGREVPRTRSGSKQQELGSVLSERRIPHRELLRLLLFGQTPLPLANIDVAASFELPTAGGQYTLEVTPVVLKATASPGVFAPVPLPAAKLTLRIPERMRPAKKVNE